MGTSMMKAITYSEFGISTDVLKLNIDNQSLDIFNNNEDQVKINVKK